MKKNSLFLFALLLCNICIYAQHSNESEAIQIASDFYGKTSNTPRLPVVSHKKIDALVRRKIATMDMLVAATILK